MTAGTHFSATEPPRGSAVSRRLAWLGDALRRHRNLVQRLQWAVVLVYLFLVAVPALLPLPDRTAHIWNDLVLFAGFVFWGLWWPFVLLSMVLVGRTWCGLFCPEGTLSEAASRFGKALPVPRWITWKGWPFTAFAGTTIYGQMVSVYQYPRPALLILGGSTLAAVVVGALFGRDKRVWCRYLCPVNGVFGLLAKLAPLHFRVDMQAWARSRGAGKAGLPAIDCAPLVAVKTMRGAADCHMCGRCSGFRGAIALAPRAPGHEIVHVAGARPAPAETFLIVFGLMGLAAGAFHWSASPWFIEMKQACAMFLFDHGLGRVAEIQPPWWILTDYPERADRMNLLDGLVLLAYVALTTLVIGAAVSGALAVATCCLGRWSRARYHHLAQSLVPIAGCGVFLGLGAVTVTMLRSEGVPSGFVAPARAALLLGAALWSLALAWQITGLATSGIRRRVAATAAMGVAVSIGVASSVLLFWVW